MIKTTITIHCDGCNGSQEIPKDNKKEVDALKWVTLHDGRHYCTDCQDGFGKGVAG